MNPPAATVVITTRNRREELARALRSAVAQRGVECEVLVIDDGSTDGTAEMVRTQFPMVRLERREASRGLIVRRNEGARLARGAVIVSIDDDAEFSDFRTVAQTLADFDDAEPRIGAVAIPFVNVLQSSEVHQRAPSPEGCLITDTFIGTAHALRREWFLALGGYREELIHQGEERDFCLRMLAAGGVVRLGSAEPILHHESHRRDWARMDFYGWRNNVLFAWHNVPQARLTRVLLAVTVSALRHMLTLGRSPLAMLRGLGIGAALCMRRQVLRRPVSLQVYLLNRRLIRRGPLPLSEIEPIITVPPPSFIHAP